MAANSRTHHEHHCRGQHLRKQTIASIISIFAASETKESNQSDASLPWAVAWQQTIEASSASLPQAAQKQRKESDTSSASSPQLQSAPKQDKESEASRTSSLKNAYNQKHHEHHCRGQHLRKQTIGSIISIIAAGDNNESNQSDASCASLQCAAAWQQTIEASPASLPLSAPKQDSQD